MGKRKKKKQKTTVIKPTRFCHVRLKEYMLGIGIPAGNDTEISKQILSDPQIYLIDRNEFRSWLESQGPNIGLGNLPNYLRDFDFKVSDESALWFEFLKDEVLTMGIGRDPFNIVAIGKIGSHILVVHRVNGYEKVRLFQKGLLGIKEDAGDYVMQLHGIAGIVLSKMLAYLDQEEVEATREPTKPRQSTTGKTRNYSNSKIQRLYRKRPSNPSSPSKENAEDKGQRGPIEYSHRFEVRGHWRKVSGLGKDHEGNLVQGYTWVKESIKGPKNKPVVKKVRLVKDQLPPGFQRA